MAQETSVIAGLAIDTERAGSHQGGSGKMSNIVERTLSGGSIRALPEHPAILDERAGVSELPLPGSLSHDACLEGGVRPSGKSLLVFRRLREARPIPGPRRQQLML